MISPMSRVDDWLQRVLASWVDAVRRRARFVAAGTVALTLVLGAYTALNLGINSDNLGLISQSLPSRAAYEEFTALFPALDDSLLIVVDGETPELARTATDALLAGLRERTDRFTDVYIPGGGTFFERNGLLYRSVEELEEFGDQMARLQPVIAELERDPSISNLATLIREGLDAAYREDRDTDEWVMVLDRVGAATLSVYEEFPLSISWEEVLMRGSSIAVIRRWVIVADPILDPTQLLLAGDALETVRELASELELVPERGIRVRVTGNPALNYEEMFGLAWDIGMAGLFCFALFAIVLYVALRSLRIVVAGLVTLLVGLIWTAAFAAVAVGELNLISITFAVLFIGLGVDFAIHLGMQYADHLRRGDSQEQALRASAGSVGSSLSLCVLTTAIGFYVFVPSDFRGFAELGLIAGTGMFVIYGLTLTFFPALLGSWLRVDPATLKSDLRFRVAWWGGFARHPRAVVAVALVAALGALAVLPGARFDPNVVAMRDHSTESFQAFNDLLEQTDARSPWFVNAVAPDLPSAQALAARLEEVEGVESAIVLADYVPREQVEKLEILGDVAMLLDAAGGGGGLAYGLSVEQQVVALRELHAFLDAPSIDGPDSPLAESMRQLHRQLGVLLERLESDGNAPAALASLEEILLAGFPQQIARLRTAIDPSPIGLGDLPAELRDRMLAPDGRARVQVFPSEDLMNDGALGRFVAAIRPLAPVLGIPVNLVEFGEVTVASFRQALVSAFVAIALLVWLLWRRAAEVALALAPVLLAALLTGATIVLFGMSFNFASVIVIPLLLAIGVDSGIHLVHRAQHTELAQEGLLETTTARAVFYSALTTTVSFGSLAFSGHHGMHTLGVLLAVGMIYTVMCNLIVLPALIDLRHRPVRVSPR